MKKISNVTQTYGNERYEEVDNFLSKENIKILNLFDFITYSFHNCNNEFKNDTKTKILKKIPNCIFFEFNNISYTESIICYLDNLKKLGCTDFILWQDDHYFNDYEKSYELFKEVFNFYKNNSELYYFKVFGMCYHIINKKINIIKTYDLNNNLKIYTTYTNEFKKSGYWAYTDENYIMNIDKARKFFFTESVKNMNVWELEKYLKKVSETINIEICLTNAYFFERCGLHGPNRREYGASPKISYLRAKKYNNTLKIN